MTKLEQIQQSVAEPPSDEFWKFVEWFKELRKADQKAGRLKKLAAAARAWLKAAK
jgi:hypothetical protein